jgi:protein TonB
MAISLLMLTRRTKAPAFADARYGYGQQSSGQRAVSAGLALSIAGGVGAALALALAVPEMTRPETRIFTGTNIPLPQPIDPLVDPTPQPRTPTDSHITVPRNTRIPPINDAATGELIDIMVPPAVGTDIGEGALGGVGIPDPVPAPTPVFQQAVRDSRYARAFQPDYPPSAERDGIEGTARVRVHINTVGRVTAVENLGATDERFFAATQRQALRSWRFVPATRDGQPVETTLELTVTFRIPDPD